MIWNITKIDEKLQSAVKEFEVFALDERGVEVVAQTGGNKVEYDGKTLRIYHKNKRSFVFLLFVASAWKEGEARSFVCKDDFDDLCLLHDLSRNCVKTVETLKEFMRMLVLTGYDSIQLYMEDVYEIPEEPYFGYKRGRYAQEELSELVEYAERIGLECVPAVQTLAHLNCIARWERFSRRIIDFGDILLADEEETYELIENMFKSLRASFTTDKINIGMDEAHMVGLGKYLDKHGYTDRSSIIVRHLKRVCEIAEKYGFTRPMMWNDMFIRLANQGRFETPDRAPEEIVKLIPENISLAGWNYYSLDKGFYIDMLKMQKMFGRNVYFAGGVNNWHGITPQNKFALKQTEVAMQACRDMRVRNYILTSWGDDGGECSPFASLPAIAFAGANARGVQGYKSLFYTMTGIRYCDFLTLDLPNDVSEKSVAFTQLSKYMLYNDCFLGLMDSTVKAGDKEPFKGYAKTLARHAKKAKWGYLFRTQQRLAELLYIKYDLGVRTRKAYTERDTATLRALAENDYERLIKKAAAFYEVAKYQWHAESKPHGFEVQDYRMGGLRQRIVHLRERLTEYLDGKLARL
ncbi:MAG: beta-N-acetylhexosaminidase, partial [Clostridia bacterium]|nr:beta-N-acetylhexosaminidase [Clostridia bacterium]